MSMPLRLIHCRLVADDTGTKPITLDIEYAGFVATRSLSSTPIRSRRRCRSARDRVRARRE